MTERVRFATLSVHVSPRGGFHCEGALGRMRLIGEPGLPDRAGFATIDLVLVGDRCRGGPCPAAPRLARACAKGGAAALVMANRRNGVRA